MGHPLEAARHLLAPLGSRCGEFHARWKAAAAAGAADDMNGRWEGEWVSTVTGHRGPLRCVIETVSDERWNARFQARYARIFRACYLADFHVARLGPDRYTFSGNTDLGWAAGGTYEYDGQGNALELTCRYRSRLDRGEFKLRRSVGGR